MGRLELLRGGRSLLTTFQEGGNLNNRPMVAAANFDRGNPEYISPFRQVAPHGLASKLDRLGKFKRIDVIAAGCDFLKCWGDYGYGCVFLHVELSKKNPPPNERKAGCKRKKPTG